MQCGGAMKKAKLGMVVNDPTKREVRQAMREERKMDRKDKRFMRQYEKQKAEELMNSKRFKTGGQANLAKTMPGYNATIRPMQMKEGGAKPSMVEAVKTGCPPGTQRLANGKCGERPLYGG